MYMKATKIPTHCIALVRKFKLGLSEPSWEFELTMQSHTRKASQNGAGVLGPCSEGP